MRKYFFQTLMLLLSTATWIGCGKDDDNKSARYTISGNGSGNQVVPQVTNAGTCTISGTYIAESKALNYSVSFSNLSANATGMHFHGPADALVNAPVMVPVAGFPAATSGNFSGTATLTASQDSALTAGKMYFDIHSATNPNGEVRAQIGATRVN